MTKKKYSFSFHKQIFFWIFLSVIVVMTPFLAVTGYFVYKKLSYSFEFGEKFGVFDDELGWTLKKNASSYIRGRSLITGETFFDSSVYTNDFGFRSQNSSEKFTAGRIVAIGDSWTFGYCVNYEETYPYFLEKISNVPVTNLGVPAYGSGSTYGLFKRHVSKLQPKLVIYLTSGLWKRSLSTVYPPDHTDDVYSSDLRLIPYFYYDQKTDSGQIKFPNPGAVTNSINKGIYPGGSLTAGYNTFNYLWYVKIPQILSMTKTYLKKVSSSAYPQKTKKYEEHKINKILQYELELYKELSNLYQFKLLIIDLSDQYTSVVKKFNKQHPDNKVMFIGRKEFVEEVYTKGINIGLSPEEIRVPMDGHYGRGTNKLIAEMIIKKIKSSRINLE